MKTVEIMMLMALVAAARVASAGPASEAFVTDRVERSGREVSAQLSARIADATNGIPGRIESARARAVEEATRHVSDVRAEILSVANRTSEALSRATVATNAATAVGRRVDALERGLESERDARTEAVDEAARAASLADARASVAMDRAAAVSNRVDALARDVRDGVTREQLAAKADEFTEWFNDVDNDRFHLVLEDPYGHGELSWWIYLYGSRREFSSCLGDKESVSLTWHAHDDWDADFDITFTRRRVLRTGDVDTPSEVDAKVESAKTELNARIGRSLTTSTNSISETRIRNIKSAPAMSIVPEESRNTLPVNRWRVVRIGDDETVTRMTDAEADRILVSSPGDLFFIESSSVSGGVTNYVLKSLQSYLDAVSPLAVGDLIGQYLPTNGGGTVTGEVTVLGNLYVSGEVSMPNLVDVRTANIIANGFVVSNRVVVAESGLMVSNGVCHINGAIAKGTIQATRVHIMDGGDVTFGGSPENPTAGMLGMIEGVTLAKLSELGFNGNTLTPIGSTEGAFVEGTIDRFARLADIVSHASPNCVRPIGDRVSAGGTRASITLRNWCLNVPAESLSATQELRVFYPLHEIRGNLDMTQRLSFGIYFASAPAAAVRWDYAPDDGGFELRGETGGELDSISAGDYIWFQQIGPTVLSVTKRNVSNTIHPLVNE